jgi:hypothetical protein
MMDLLNITVTFIAAKYCGMGSGISEIGSLVPFLLGER